MNLDKLIEERDKLKAELKKEYENVRYDPINGTVGPEISFDETQLLGLYVDFRKGVRNSHTEKANKIWELERQIDLLMGDAESRDKWLKLIFGMYFNPPLQG